MEIFIFDLDYTLLIPDWSKEDIFFKENLPLEEFFKLMEIKQFALNEYEKVANKYELTTLSVFYKQYNVNLPKEVIEKWMIYNGNTIIDTLNDGTLELLDYLKKNKKRIVLLSNWFSVTQIMRLKRSNIYDYFDLIICGDQAMKPSSKSFELAIQDYPKEKCIMIGDDAIKDYQGAIEFGINAYLLDKNHTLTDFLNELKDESINSKTI